MATYAIGDVQGCYNDLRRLLDAIPIDLDSDELWFAGDLVNRGPNNLRTLRFVKSLDRAAVTVLGNHDLHLLAVVFGGHSVQRSDTFTDVTTSTECLELCHWLRSLPLLHESANHVLTHAGIPHIWNLASARAYAREVESVISGADFAEFFEHMYGNEPATWRDQLDGLNRLRLITNYLTRMRFVAHDGGLEFKHKGSIDDTPHGFRPWFRYPSKTGKTQIFGHWAALDGRTGRPDILASDTGCVWGRGLTAINLADHRRFTWLNNSLLTQP